MFATAICGMKKWKLSHARMNTGGFCLVLAGMVYLLAAVQESLAEATNAFAIRAQTNFVEARKKFLANTNDVKIDTSAKTDAVKTESTTTDSAKIDSSKTDTGVQTDAAKQDPAKNDTSGTPDSGVKIEKSE